MKNHLLTLMAATILFTGGCKEGLGVPISAVKNPDPLRQDQWYLNGVADRPDIVHANVDTALTGQGVLIAIVDDGLDTLHEDLVSNISDLNYSYLPIEHDFSQAKHGTACAGIIAAEGYNGIGLHGVAPKASLVGYNAVRLPSISNLADALVRNAEEVSISNNSWGDFNAWGEPFKLRPLIEEALAEGVTRGRGGKGIIYVFSAGNGAGSESDDSIVDNVNYSGLVNNRYTIPVCAVTETGKRSKYSEIGATLLVCAPSNGGGLSITTTDVAREHGYNPTMFPDEDYDDQNYTRFFGGTSASAPIVSGVVALVLEANPDLGWRDVRAILAKSAKVIDKDHHDWTTNGARIPISHYYGFGLIDAAAAIELAESWQNFGEEVVLDSGKLAVEEAIPDDNSEGTNSSFYIDDDVAVEFVEIFFDAPDHPRIGDLDVRLISPSGTESVLSERHEELFGGFFRYSNWRFGSMRHLDEPSRGTWRIVVKDLESGEMGSWESWQIRVIGHRR